MGNISEVYQRLSERLNDELQKMKDTEPLFYTDAILSRIIDLVDSANMDSGLMIALADLENPLQTIFNKWKAEYEAALTDSLVDSIFETALGAVPAPQKEEKSESKKYEITRIRHPTHPALFRIRSLRPVTHNVGAGVLGGYVASEDNLSQEGESWIFDDAICMENAVVTGDSQLREQAVLSDYAVLSNNACAKGKSWLRDHAVVTGGIVDGNAQICGNAVIQMNEQTQCAPVVSGNAIVMGTISGAMRVVKNAFVLPSQTVENPTDLMVYMDGKTNRLMTQGEFFNYIQNQKRNEECL